jgi:gluconate 2-dehydrogenase gamma chain
MNDPRHPSSHLGVSRRALLVSGAAASVLAPAAMPVAAQNAPVSAAFQFLTRAEADALTALVDRLIPADATGPGGVEAGVVLFIDRQLAGQFGAGARWYMQGPWLAGTPTQGYQLGLVPSVLYRKSLLALDRWCRGTRAKAFSDLPTAEQDAVLGMLEAGKIDLDGIPSKAFFTELWGNVVEGYLSDPLYEGNKNMAAWKMIGFPGPNPVLIAALHLEGKPYVADPMAIGG